MVITLPSWSSSMTLLTRPPYQTPQIFNRPITIRSVLSIPQLSPSDKRSREQNRSNTIFINNKNTKTTPLPLENNTTNNGGGININTVTKTLLKLHIVLEAVLDRIEMHHNVGEQRENWNALLLNSLNMLTLTAATMAGVASVGGNHTLPLKLSSVVLFSAATGVILLMNKIQPSQLVEEQRTAVRLFKQLRTDIQTQLTLENINDKYVEDAMAKVLALDRAYPLPLLGAMLEKYPKTLKPAVWWPNSSNKPSLVDGVITKDGKNGWSKDLEEKLRDIVGVIERRDKKDYIRLGNKALKFNKILAKVGPTLMGVAAVSSVFSGHGGPWAGLVAAAAGSMASVVNSVQHGGQVGMVFEMYRNCAGFLSLLEESVENNVEESDLGKRENGELFEMKMALKLGRSVSELRDFVNESNCSWLCEDGSPKGEFASKLF
ncbi:putative F-box protein At4g22030 [Silene latifolia]|uniref:putative F-box protein At4g22030 n=1 Tax=Silene latifolia TaxID=37657 RepID=UPI003D783F0F